MEAQQDVLVSEQAGVMLHRAGMHTIYTRALQHTKNMVSSHIITSVMLFLSTTNITVITYRAIHYVHKLTIFEI